MNAVPPDPIAPCPVDPITALRAAYTEKLHVDVAEDDGPVNPFWTALGYDRFYDTLLPELEPAWNRLRELDLFRWARAHGIFREDALDDPAWSSFADARRVIDVLRHSGLRPVIELGRIPKAFANPGHPLGFEGDLDGWAGFVRQFVQTLIATYGVAEVCRWPFEFWNEPDHHFWSGDQPIAWREDSGRRLVEDYVRMYAVTADAVKSVCGEIRVGGPALTGNTVFLRAFLHEVRRRGAPLDFLSFHCYSSSPERMPCMENFLGRLQEMQDLTKRYEVDHLPWFLTEWGATWGGGRTVEAFPVNHRNTLRAATFTLKLIKEMRRYPLAMALYWGFSEWAWRPPRDGEGDFTGHRALLTYSHLDRPVLGAYRLLGALGGRYLHTHRMTDTNNVDGLACRDGDTVTMLFWHHDPDPLETAHPSRTEILFEHLPFHRARLRIEGFTREHNTFSAWQRDGCSPRSPSPEERQRLDAARDPLLLRDEIVEIHRGAWSTGEMQMFPGECLRLQLQGRP